MAGDVWALKVFQRAYRLSLMLHRASLGWPRVEQYGGVADQLRRSSKSVCALMVEGGGRQPGSNAEFRRYLSMAMGSADEARLWCDYAADLDYLPRETSLAWQDELSQIARMLHGLRDSLGATACLKTDD
jgi:four helix bundle protein